MEFKKEMPPILGYLGEVKYISTPLIDTRTPKLRNAHSRVRGVFPRALKYLYGQRIKLQAGINRELHMHTEARILASEILGNCGVFLFEYRRQDGKF